MKNIISKIAILVLGASAIISCTKKANDWNLNPQPTIAVDSVVVTPVDSVSRQVPAGSQLVVDTSAAVKIYFTASSANNISQISFHDGSWAGTVKMVTSDGLTINATPPSSKYRPQAGRTVEKFYILLPKISGQTVLSMIVSDEHDMSTSFSYIIYPNMLPKNK